MKTTQTKQTKEDGGTLGVRCCDLLAQFGRAQLGIDGNCGFALLGSNIQEGECEFVEIPHVVRSELPNTRHEQFTHEMEMHTERGNKIWAAAHAMHNLRQRLRMPNLSFYYGLSHPYGG